MNLTYENQGVIGTMTGVTVMKKGDMISIAIPYYCNNSFGIEATVSQISMFGKYDVQLMTIETPNNSPDSRAGEWYDRLIHRSRNTKPALIKLVDPETKQKVAVYYSKLNKNKEGKDYSLELTRIKNWTDGNSNRKVK